MQVDQLVERNMREKYGFRLYVSILSRGYLCRCFRYVEARDEEARNRGIWCAGKAYADFSNFPCLALVRVEISLPSAPAPFLQ